MHDLLKGEDVKRSKNIRLDRMRKGGSALFLSATLTGCGDTEGVVVSSVSECVKRTKLSQAECGSAYEKARQNSLSTNPQYFSEESCKSEFKECERRPDGQWVPKMEGFLVEEGEVSGTHLYHHPVVHYYRPFNSLHDTWMTADGTVLGKANTKNVAVPSSAFSAAPSRAVTVQRGGFGSVASSKGGFSGGGYRSGFGS